jgi:predicted transcriptional regulator
MGARAQHALAYRRLCTLLRKWRRDQKLTQRALAARLTKPHSYVHKVEVGDRRIDPVEFVAWCKACRVDPRTAIARIQAVD